MSCDDTTFNMNFILENNFLRDVPLLT